MKRTHLAFALFALLGTGCGPSYMIKREQCPDLRTIKPPAGKGAVIVGRTTKFGGGVNFEHYLNQKFIGSTKGYGFFVTPMDTGDQFVTAQSENHNTVYLKVEPDKTYYLQDGVSMGLMKAHVFLDRVKGEDMYKSMDGDCSFYVLDSTQKVDDLDPDEWKSAQEAKTAKSSK
jgi:hypothetical protein